jgi:ribosomal protein S10
MDKYKNLIYFLLYKVQTTNTNRLHIRTYLKGRDILLSKKVNKTLYFILFNLSIKIKLLIVRLKNDTIKLIYADNYSISSTSKLYSDSLAKRLFTSSIYVSQTREFLLVCGIGSLKKTISVYKELFYLFVMNLICISFTSRNRIANVSSMPSKRTLKTVIRSPHIYKRSREQFERVSYHSFIQYFSIIKTLDPLIPNVLSDYGVELSNEYISNMYK